MEFDGTGGREASEKRFKDKMSSSGLGREETEDAGSKARRSGREWAVERGL